MKLRFISLIVFYVLFFGGGMGMVGYLADTNWPVNLLTILDSFGEIHQVTFSVLLGCAGIVSGMVLGYRTAWILEVKSNMDKERRRLQGEILKQMEELEEEEKERRG